MGAGVMAWVEGTRGVVIGEEGYWEGEIVYWGRVLWRGDESGGGRGEDRGYDRRGERCEGEVVEGMWSGNQSV